MADIRYNKSIVKNINESVIRKAIREDGPFTKTKIAHMTDLSFPTVSRIIDEMSKTGEILHNGVDPTTGGRHAMSYVINPNFAYFLCMYVTHPHGNMCVSTLIINSVGDLVHRKEVGCENLSKLVETMDKIVEEEKENYPIRALSIGLPWGIRNGVILFGAKDTGLMNFNMQEHMEEKFHITTRVENDLNAAVVGCYERSTSEVGGSMVCISIGSTGLGCGFYLRGHLIRGFHGFAGEFQYLPVSDHNTVGTHMAKGEFQVEDVAKIVAAISCSVDPQSIVFYGQGVNPADFPEIINICKRYMPEETLPELTTSDKFQEDFENGLITFGKEMLLSGYEAKNR